MLDTWAFFESKYEIGNHVDVDLIPSLMFALLHDNLLIYIHIFSARFHPIRAELLYFPMTK